nr:pilus assembly protein [uncultured Dialister sp.]
MKKQGGQDIVEFALMLPLFLLFIFTIMYFGFLYGDYITLSSLARSAAREAAIEGESIPDESKNDPDAQPSYQNLEDRYDAIIREKGITTHLYEYQGISISKTGDKTSDGIPANSVVVEIKTVRNKDFGIANALEEMGIKLLPQYTIEYYMYNENGTKSNS